MRRFRRPILINMVGLLMLIGMVSLPDLKVPEMFKSLLSGFAFALLLSIVISTLWLVVLALLPAKQTGWRSAGQRCLALATANLAPITLAVTSYFRTSDDGVALFWAAVFFMIPAAVLAGFCIIAAVAIAFAELSRQWPATSGISTADPGPGPGAAKPS